MVDITQPGDKPELIRIADIIDDLPPATQRSVRQAAAWGPADDPHIMSDLLADIIALTADGVEVRYE